MWNEGGFWKDRVRIIDRKLRCQWRQCEMAEVRG